MKYRIQFSKSGRLKFIGHLDLLRTFQRVLKRAQIPLAYSQGFNPHPLLSFAHPLALGSTGLREYMEMQLEKEMEEKEILARLNANFPEHLHASLCERIPEGTPAAMAQVCAARYTIGLPQVGIDWASRLAELLSQDAILVEKLGKKHGRKQMVSLDIKPLIESCAISQDGTMELLCVCGSEQNLKPDRVVHRLMKDAGRPELAYTETIEREELYRKEEGRLLPLLPFAR